MTLAGSTEQAAIHTPAPINSRYNQPLALVGPVTLACLHTLRGCRYRSGRSSVPPLLHFGAKRVHAVLPFMGINECQINLPSLESNARSWTHNSKHYTPESASSEDI